jgi:thiol-disulfide isomerase/thioredoxin
VLACLLLLVGCSDLSGTGEKGYITGQGEITTVPPAERGEPVELEGEDLQGRPLSLADLRGEVAVVNVWWSACPPCRTEMPMLVGAAKETADRTEFVGINIRDASVEQAQGFVRTFDVPYPSFHDPGGKALLAFAGTLSPRSIPSTVLLDEQGRIAATVIGEMPSEQTLVDLVDQVSVRDAGGTGGDDAPAGGNADG